MDKIRIGSVGLGRLGLEHAKNIATRIPGAELTALCDIDTEKLHRVGEELCVRHYCTSFEEMLAIDELDAVAIVSPSALHCAQIAQALERGKHVFCEKPL